MLFKDQSVPRFSAIAAFALAAIAAAVVVGQQPRQVRPQSQVVAEQPQQQTTAEAPDADAELKRGNYDAAIALFRAQPGDEKAQAGTMRAYFETGRYQEAEALASKALTKNRVAPSLRYELGEVYAETGRYREAMIEYERAAREFGEANKVAALRSDLRRGETLALVGRGDEAQPLWRGIVTYYERVQPTDAEPLTIAAAALAHLEQYRDASDLYLEAIEADTTHVEAHLGGGALFTEKYNYAEAAEFYRDALNVNSHSAAAYVGVARNKKLEGGPEMEAALAEALKINPRSVAAHTLRATALMEMGRYADAATAIGEAQKTNPNSSAAHALRAALFYLENKDYNPPVQAALLINPRDGELYDTLAHFATITRRYHQAVLFAQKAVELSPRLWRAHLSLGMALMRTGRVAEGRAAIETSFAGDAFNLWAKNTLDLLDSMKDYKETREGNFLIISDAREGDVLTPYASALLKDAAAKLHERYRFTPQGPIRIELFANHEDFAVRALGLPGLGALGVCFGQVVALDSPTARPVGEFNWGSTLWHEYVHVITLQMTDYRIPRWFSEGLSVYEERRARPGWGDEWNQMVLAAFDANRWFKIADLDAGFQQPRTPMDVPLAYFEASQVCEFVVERYGFDAILQMLARYRDKATTADVLRQVLKLSEEEFDQQFQEFVRGKAAPYLSALKTAGDSSDYDELSKPQLLAMLKERESFWLHLRAGRMFAAENNEKQAARHFERALQLFPFQIGRDNPYERLAATYEKSGDASGAARAREALIKLDETNFTALRLLADHWEKTGDTKRALEVLELAFYISPFDPALHARAGEIYLKGGEAAKATDEFRVALKLEPPNVAEAQYNLARALSAAGRTAEARRAVLIALEEAPSFNSAQELLLKINNQ